MAVFTSDGIEPHDLRVKDVAVEKAVTGIRNSSIKMEQVRSRRSIHVARAAGRRNHNKRKIPFPWVTQPFNTSILFEDCRNAEIFHHTLPRKTEVRRIVSENISCFSERSPERPPTQWAFRPDPVVRPSVRVVARRSVTGSVRSSNLPESGSTRLSIRGCWKASSSRTCSTTDCAFDYN